MPRKEQPGGKSSLLPDSSHWLWDRYVSRIKAKPSCLSVILETWEPDSPGSIEFLEAFTQVPSSMNWWRKRKGDDAAAIIQEVLRIDDGRGIILPWLASILREERMEEKYIFWQSVSKWQARNGRFPLVWLKAWEVRVKDQATGIRRLAWATVAQAWRKVQNVIQPILQSVPEDKSVPENRGDEWYEWETYLAELVKNHLPHESDQSVLEIMSQLKPSGLILKGKVWYDIFQQWERKMQELPDFRPAPGLKPETDTEKFKNLRRIIWRGMILSGTGNGDADAVIAAWLGIHLSREKTPEVLEVIARWAPVKEKLPETIQVLWSQKLHNDENQTGKVKKLVWKALGKGCQADNTEAILPEAAWEACQKGLQDEDDPQVLMAVKPPAGLSEQQQLAWISIWTRKFHGSNEDVRLAAGIHLLYLLGLKNRWQLTHEAMKQSVLERLENEPSAKVIKALVTNLMGNGADGETGGGILVEGWERLRRSPAWKDRNIRLEAVTGLGQQLERATEATVRIPLKLWAEAVRDESDEKVLEFMSTHVCKLLTSEGMRLPDEVRPRLTEDWGKRLSDPQAKVRQVAWKVMIALGDEAGDLVAKYLDVETSWNVVETMAEWQPSGRKPLPAGFWEAWTSCFIRKEWTAKRNDPGVIQPSVNRLAEKIKIAFDKWTPRNHEEMMSALFFWQTLSSLPEADIMTKSLSECRGNLLKKVFFEDDALDAFRDRVHGMSPSEYNMLMKRMEICEAEKMGPDVKRYQAIAAASGLVHFYFDTELCRKNCQTLKRVWNDMPIHRTEAVDGWDDVRRALVFPYEKKAMWRVHVQAQILSLGHQLRYLRHKNVFIQALEEVQKQSGHPQAHIMETALWREVAVQITDWMKPDEETTISGALPDQTTELRIFRQFIHNITGGTVDPGKTAPASSQTGWKECFWERVWEILRERMEQSMMKDIPKEKKNTWDMNGEEYLEFHKPETMSCRKEHPGNGRNNCSYGHGAGLN